MIYFNGFSMFELRLGVKILVRNFDDDSDEGKNVPHSQMIFFALKAKNCSN
jgi:hypothetical protein